MCEGRWRVRNPNDEAIRFTWDIAGQEEKGAGIVPANSDVFFYTQGGSQTARLFVDGEQQQVKASNPSACGSSTPVEGSFTWQDDQTVSFAPNAALEPGTYALQITDAAKNNQEQTLEPFDSSFTVAAHDDPSSLPAPWQQETLGEGTGNATFDAPNQAFTLNVEGNQSNHFVYQSLEGNGSLVARVTDLETIDQNGKAGLMLRGSLAPDAPYALLALTPAGITFEVKGEDGTLTREAGSLQGPVWLKLERKEDRVYAYESEDGLSWQLVATTALLLSNPTQLGMSLDAQSAQVRLSEVSLQTEEDTKDVEAKFSYDVPFGIAPLEVTFDASESVGKGLKYEWDFGDGTTAKGKKVKPLLKREESFL